MYNSYIFRCSTETDLCRRKMFFTKRVTLISTNLWNSFQKHIYNVCEIRSNNTAQLFIVLQILKKPDRQESLNFLNHNLQNYLFVFKNLFVMKNRCLKGILSPLFHETLQKQRTIVYLKNYSGSISLILIYE